MPLVEFMMHPVGNGTIDRVKIPDFIRGSADFYNPEDETYVGWVADNRKFYLPDSVVQLTKETFVDRVVAINAANPPTNSYVDPDTGNIVEGEPLSEAEVRANAEAIYDRIVNHCKQEEGSN